ncbi:cadherin-23-like [Mytilus trossulus]|uniref:cadherin-23-like n=1 Tax=Mytilus trossulus TaxID=6551 RepID=UPI003007D6DD
MRKIQTFSLSISISHSYDFKNETWSFECSSQIYTVKITETKQVGSSLIQLDCKDKESQHLIYKLYKGDATKFSMEDHGELKLKKEIDTDKEDNFWTVEVEVRDHGVPRLDTFVHINIFVEDVDDHKPFWHPANNGTYTVSIIENSDVGTFVAMVTAIDDDRPGTKHSKIKYAIEDMTKAFTIESNTGKIIVASPDLDREDKDHYKLSVSAHSSDMISEKIFGEISIKITDENDNYPVFSQEIYSAAWPEDTKINSVLLSVRASDVDEGRNRKISYSIQDGNMDDGCRMSVDKNLGKISTDSQFDYERKQSCFLTVVASDDGNKPLVATASVLVSVTGVNEFPPMFVRQSYTVSVLEDITSGTSMTQVQANDEDHGEDGFITYSIATHSDIFTVDKDSGIIRPVIALDSDTTGSYLVEVHAIDQSKTAKQTGTTTLTVVVDDVNEVGPLCKTVASVEVPSSSIVGDLVYELKCSDSDVGPNGDLSYTINKGNINLDFTIDSQGHIVVAKVLSKPFYNLEVAVFDGGIPPKKSPVHIKVNVIGEPEFLQLPKTLDINEDDKIGDVIYVVKSTSKYQFMRFSIKSGNSDGVFGINDVTGDIYLISNLDREQTPSYSLTLQLTDIISKLTSTSSVNIRIKDSNDNIPTFDNSFDEFSVIENIPIKTTIGQVSARDTDEGINAVVEYSVQSGNIGNTFTLSTKGELILNKALDAEAIADYILTIIAHDKGKPSLTGTTTVVVLVKDFDEFPITFITGNPFKYTIPENAPLGAYILAVKAEDPDKGAQIHYQITDGNDGSFNIDSKSGNIILGRRVDRENVPEYNLTVVADNGAGDKTSTVVAITVSDINDHDPYCQQHFISANVHENETSGTIVTNIKCDDKDIAENANLMYSIISGNTGNGFRLNNTYIVVNSPLDYETINNYIIGIEVKDQGSPPRSSTILVTVDVFPFYKSPKLYETKVKINISEGIIVGTTVYDIDATLNGATEGTWNIPGDLEYVLQSLNDAKYFSTDFNTGEIIISGNLDRENIKRHKLIVKCVNRYNRNLYDILTIEIDVFDVNDNSPFFSNAAYIFLVDEDANISSSVGKVEAVDYDINENADLEYDIVAGEHSDSFVINSTSGIISVNNSLNASVQKGYVMSVEVTDNGSPRRSSRAKVMIKVNDINNHKPRFRQTMYYVDVREDVDIGDIIYQLQADDPDLDLNGKVTYSIESGNDEINFGIHLQEGHIYISEKLDREKNETYNMKIIAKDGGVPSKTSTTSLRVTVIDVNDNNPIFSRAIYDVKIDRFITAGKVIAKVHATDSDKDLNSKIDFFIIDGNEDNFILINISTGEIKTNAFLHMAADFHKIVIKAADNGYPRLSATAKVNIAIYPSVINQGSHFEFSVLENVSIGTYVGKVLQDNIHGQQGQAYFSLLGGDSIGLFSIEQASGILRTEEFFDREDVDEYFLTISIVDRLNNKTNYHKLVHVIIDDINDSNPWFLMPYREISVVENSPVGLPVVQFSVTDDDINENGNITLSIDPSDPLANALFEMNNDKSMLVLKIIPDYEMISDLALTVFAEDAGYPPRTATAEVVVNIIDVKDTKPYEDKPATYFSLECALNAHNGESLTTFTPHDFGIYQSLADPVKFVTMNKGGVFDIHPDRGDLYVQNENFLYRDTRYVMWGIVQAKTNGTWNSAAGVIRVDTLIPNQHMVIIEHDVPVTTVRAQRCDYKNCLNKIIKLSGTMLIKEGRKIPKGQSNSEIENKLTNMLKYALQALFPLENRVGIWDIIDEDTVVGRRKLLSTRSKSLVYVVKDRTTDTLEGVQKEKSFLTQNDILKVLRRSDDGTPAYPLESKSFDTFPVNSVSPYRQEEPSPPSWFQTDVGIAVVLTIIFSLILLATILSLYFYCTRESSEGFVGSSKLFIKFPSDSDMLSDQDYPDNRHSRLFKPWNASCTSINGTQNEYITRQERWEDMLDKAGLGFQTLRKPVGPPMPYHLNRTKSDLTQKKLNPWIFKYRDDKPDVDQLNNSLTAYSTKVQRYSDY